MRKEETDSATVELLPLSLPKYQAEPREDEIQHKSSDSASSFLQNTEEVREGQESKNVDNNDIERHAPPAKRRFVLDWYELSYLILVCITAFPIILLATYAPHLSSYLGSQACLPNGDFVLPGLSSVWTPSYFFTLSVTLGTNSQWTYTHAKIIDIAWDVCAGRGGQILLLYVIYHVGHSAIERVMETRNISFDTYSAVAFRSGTLRAVMAFLSSSMSERFPTDRHSLTVFLALGLSTLYIVAMPSLFAAMTGYAAVSTPSVELPPPAYLAHGSYTCGSLGGCTLVPCGGQDSGNALLTEGGLLAGWGVVIDAWRFGNTGPYPISSPVGSWDTGQGTIVDYYNTHKAAYDALISDPQCRNVGNLTECPATNIDSIINLDESGAINAFNGTAVQLGPPLLDIQLWGNNLTTGLPNTWLCNEYILPTSSFSNGGGYSHASNITGVCTAGPYYQWGFSFLLLFSVCILNLLFAATMYALWIDARRNRRRPLKFKEVVIPETGGKARLEKDEKRYLMADAFELVTQVEREYGSKVREWGPTKLRTVVRKGKKGMRIEVDE